jgi:hypothetical protein
LPDANGLKTGKFIARSDLRDLTLSSFSIIIRHSKTIQFGQRLLKLPYVASVDSRLCPVRAVVRHIGTSVLDSMCPLFDFCQDGLTVSVTHSWFVKRLKAGLLRTGNKASEISCHSFRRGGTTLAFSLGLSATDIKLRGDWASNAYEKYLVVSSESLVNSVQLLTSGAASLSLR